jgi:hypothetical protein
MVSFTKYILLHGLISQVVHLPEWPPLPRTSSLIASLKVPMCEIFDCKDFPDFYTLKSLSEGDFGVKI